MSDPVASQARVNQAAKPDIGRDILQRKGETALAVSLFRLGQLLASGEDGEQIQFASRDVSGAVDALANCHKLVVLAEQFALDDLELELLAFVYIFALEPDLMATYANLSWFERGPGISAERVLSLCCGNREAPAETKSRLLGILGGESNLVRWNIVVRHDPAHPLHQPLTVSPSVFAYLSSSAAIAPDYPVNSPWLESIPLVTNPATKVVYRDCLSEPLSWLNLIDGGSKAEQQVFLQSLVSGSDSGKNDQQIAEENISSPLWLVSDPLPQSPQISVDIVEAFLAARLTVLSRPMYIWWPALWQLLTENSELRPVVELLKTSASMFVFTDEPDVRAGTVATLSFQQKSGGAVSRFSIATPSLDKLASGWMALTAETGKESDALDQQQALSLAGRYPLLTAEMADVISSIQEEDIIAPSEDGKPILARIETQCLSRIAAQNSCLATLALPSVSLADMVLQPHTVEQLQEIIDRLKYRGQLEKELPRFVPGSRGLFWGPPGTGKSMAAEAIAGELQLPLYRVNLANVASKWIGETEKHLATLFDVAETQRAILLFDEADAIFAKRSEVSSSQDKNANMGVSFLLQRMETYRGLLLLSSNLKSNIDDAFLRRLQAVIEFPLPDKAMRLILWKRVWKGKLQPAQESARSFLADNFELSPSQICNIAERAVMYAISEGTDVMTEPMLARAVRRELEKQSAGFLAGQQLTRWLAH